MLPLAWLVVGVEAGGAAGPTDGEVRRQLRLYRKLEGWASREHPYKSKLLCTHGPPS